MTISENLKISRTIADFSSEAVYILPVLKYLFITCISNLSRICCTNLNFNWTLYPILFFPLNILIEKLPSPDAKPEIQLGSGIFSIFIIGLSTGVSEAVNLDLNCSERPKLIDAFKFKLTTWYKPSIFKWVLLFISSITCLNNKKSPSFAGS